MPNVDQGFCALESDQSHLPCVRDSLRGDQRKPRRFGWLFPRPRASHPMRNPKTTATMIQTTICPATNIISLFLQSLELDPAVARSTFRRVV